MMSSNISQLVKRKRVNLSVVKKLELIKDIEKGAIVKSVCEKYGVKRQTVSNITNNKKKLKNLQPQTVLMPRFLRVTKLGTEHENREGGVFRCGSNEVVYAGTL